MIYSNVNVSAKEIEFEFGTINQIQLGERGRGRKLLALTCPPETELKEGMNKEYTIGFTKSGKPRIIKKEDDILYLLISSEGGYTRRGNGWISFLKGKEDQFTIMDIGYGADGAAGRIGRWYTALIKINNNDDTSVIRMEPSGGSMDDKFYIVHNSNVTSCTFDVLDECCEAIGIDVPFDLTKISRASFWEDHSGEEGWWEEHSNWYKKTDQRGINDWQWKLIDLSCLT